MKKSKLAGSALALWELACKCRPLADWQREHKPNLATLRIFVSDYALLLKHPETARKYGFVINDDEISFKDYLLIHDGEIRGADAPR